MTSKSPLSSGLSPQFLQGSLIIAAVIWVFSPALHGGWLWDDNVYIVANPLMNDPAGLWKIWFQPGALPDYYPLTITLQRLQWNLWGMDTFGYHLTNVVLHIVSAFLVWRLFSKLGLRLAWLGGLLFAVHPVQVESVAWMAEIKNTLSLPPFLLAMCAWIDYDRLGKRQDYFLALGLFLVALLCKITVVMFPVIILLHAWWRRGRIGWPDLKAGAPFFAVSLAVGLIPVLSGIWDRAFNHLGPEFVPAGGSAARLVLMGLEAAFYFSKSVLPVELLPVYPKWNVDLSSPLSYLPWLALAGVMIWFWLRRRTWGRHALLGLGFFLINLLPCPGFIPGPNMGYAWVMDHFLYLPIIGLIGLAVAGLGSLPETRSSFTRACPTVIALIVAVIFACGSHAYAKLYGKPLALWTYAFQHNPGSWMVRLNLGNVCMDRGQLPEAVDQFETALKFNPAYLAIRYDLANALSRSDRFSDAITQYEMLAKIDPNYHDVPYLLGAALVSAHRIPEATDQFEKILQLNPRNVEAHLALGNILLAEGKVAEAMDHYAQAATINPADGRPHFDLGNALLKENRLPEALAEFQQAAQLNPRDLDVLGNLGVVLARMGRIPEAAEQFEMMLQIDPNSAAAHTNLGSLYLVVGKLPKAIEQYQEALRLQPDFVEAQQDLARAQEMEKARQTAPPPAPR